ncbi:hypothetical protein LTR86_003059 [Recurvomyces mirabilis]|nr:hypothetical protein LTR86_003059 [Recurvomyces mirabilis]
MTPKPVQDTISHAANMLTSSPHSGVVFDDTPTKKEEVFRKVSADRHEGDDLGGIETWRSTYPDLTEEQDIWNAFNSGTLEPRLEAGMAKLDKLLERVIKAWAACVRGTEGCEKRTTSELWEFLDDQRTIKVVDIRCTMAYQRWDVSVTNGAGPAYKVHHWGQAQDTV